CKSDSRRRGYSRGDDRHTSRWLVYRWECKHIPVPHLRSSMSSNLYYRCSSTILLPRFHCRIHLSVGRHGKSRPAFPYEHQTPECRLGELLFLSVHHLSMIRQSPHRDI